MAKVYLIAALIVFQGFFFFFDVTTQSSSASASVSVSVLASLSTSPQPSVSASVSPSTSASVSTSTSTGVSTSPQPSVSASVSPSTSASVSTSTSTSVSTSPQPSVSASVSPSTSASVSTSPQPSVSASLLTSTSVSMSPSPSTSVLTSSQPSISTSLQPSPSTPASTSSTPPTTPATLPPIGSTVLFRLRIKVFHCNSSIHGNNLPETNSLFANLTTNVKTLYTNAQNVTFTSVSCGSARYVILYFSVTFNLGLPKDKNIETMLKDEIQDNKIGDLPVDGSFYNVTFVGVTLTYTIKDGECERICCGAGGEVDLVRGCSPADKCEGISPKTKKGSDYCYGEENDSCTGKVECPAGTDKACSSHFPSFAVLILSTLASFLKSTIY